MAAMDDFDAAVEQYHRAAVEFVKKNPSPTRHFFANVATYANGDLGYIVEIERFKARIGGSEKAAPVVLRTTSILRREDGAWKILHRHADPITTEQPAESVLRT